MIDLDPQGSLSSSFGIFPGNNGHDISTVLLDNVPIERVIRKTGMPLLDIIPASLRMSKEEATINLLGNQHQHKYPLKESLKYIPGNAYDFIFVDSPSFLGPITMNAIVSSNLVIIPSTLDSLSLIGVKKMIDYSLVIEKNYNPGLRYKILLTIFEEHRKFYAELAERIRQTYSNSDHLFSTAISKDINITKSQLMEEPVLSFKSNSKASIQYRALAQEIIKYAKN
jgi:chromosome partitioning protein